jgi:peptidoglycan hydrolase-like protein with peptidoglycan-binding domain
VWRRRQEEARPGRPQLLARLRVMLAGAAERLAKQERAYYDDGADISLVVVENKNDQLARANLRVGSTLKGKYKLDGVIGMGARAALRAWQKARGLTADGYLSPDIVQRLKSEAGG